MPARKAAQAAALALAPPPPPPPRPKPSTSTAKPAKAKQALVPGRLATLVLDNGADTVKLTWVDKAAAGADGEVNTVINAITRAGPKSNRKTFVADELDKECRDYDKLQYSRPMEKGILTDWNTQKLIWDRIFEDAGVDFPNTRLLVTETPFSLPNVQDGFDAMVFEEYQFAEYLRVPSAFLVALGPPAPVVALPESLSVTPSRSPSPIPFSNALPPLAPTPAPPPRKPRKSVFSRPSKARSSNVHPAADPADALLSEITESALVIDSGFSHTYVVPVADGNVIWPAVRRLDIGGKLVTNYLKELLSYRYLYMMDQTHVVARIKEKTSYVAQDYLAELRKAEDDPDSINLEYALPDFTDLTTDPTYKLGYVKDGLVPPPPPRLLPDAPVGSEPVAVEEQILTLARERFEAMELFFRPDLIGSNQAGLPDVVKESVDALPPELQGACWANLVLCGGNFACPGMATRLFKELRALAPIEYEVEVRLPSHPATHAAASASHALSSAVLHDLLDARFVSRDEYLSPGMGSTACRAMFGGAYADVDALYFEPSSANDDGGGGDGAEGERRGGKKRGRRTSSGEESELDDLRQEERPEYIVRSTASRKRAMA